MDKETLNRRISAGNFVKNNGSVLRAVNILKTKFNRLKDIKYALNIEKNDVENSINYLHEAGYLHLRNSENRQPSSLSDDDFDALEGKLTARGIQLLAGVIQDECVEV
ncbi:MAG: type VI secretion protein [Ruminococcus sp.]|nr:type VI secretion protein [Ruminococcus sp.]MDE6849239.1 type VI secretion protein [Ruminococcus sp.]MDE7137277.1 type VI secretion protein [Ruminococcus sp.]